MQSLAGQKIHFIGIGGSGMSGLARIALSDGISVSGSDAKDSTVLSALAALGAVVLIGLLVARRMARDLDLLVEGSLAASRTISPLSGLGVSRVMPAAASAAVFTQA